MQIRTNRSTDATIDDGPRRRRRRHGLLAVIVGLIVVFAAVGCTASSSNPDVAAEEDPGLTNHTIYRPADLGAVEGKLPIVVWGAGGCISPGITYEAFLSEIAVNGYLVIADLAPYGLGYDTPEQLLAGVTWAIAENTRPGSQYFGKLDTTKVAAMGHSCGGLVALHAGTDPRVSTVVAWDSGIFDTGNLGGATKDDLNHLHGPTMWVNAGPLDIAYPQAEKDYAAVPDTVPAVWANIDRSAEGDGVFGAHLGTFWLGKGGDYAIVANDWLDFTLKGDRQAGRQFIGPCHLCDRPDWSVQSKNW